VQIVEKFGAIARAALTEKYPRLCAALFPQPDFLPQDTVTVYHLLKVVLLVCSFLWNTNEIFNSIEI
jgi:hypothetical protein